MRTALQQLATDFLSAIVFVATTMSFEAWAWFITVGAVGAKVAAFLAQYWVFRSIIVRRPRAQPVAPALHAQ
jgi:hypothetical protein